MDAAQLKDNVRKILSSANLVYDNKDYTSATILYFKALFGVIDVILLQKIGKTPKDHTERFRILEDVEPSIFMFLDSHFKIYRDTYTTSIDKQTCDDVRTYAKKIMERYKI
jgi:uncharacterized protein (UPF0332 family)